MSLNPVSRRSATLVATVAFVLALPTAAHASVLSEVTDAVAATTDTVGATVAATTAGATQAVATAVPAAAPVASAADRVGSRAVAATQDVTAQLARRGSEDGPIGDVTEPVDEVVEALPAAPREREPASSSAPRAQPVATAATAAPAATRKAVSERRSAPAGRHRVPKHRRAAAARHIPATPSIEVPTAAPQTASAPAPDAGAHRSRPAEDPASVADPRDAGDGDSAAASGGVAAAGVAGWALLLTLAAAAAPTGLRAVRLAPAGAPPAIFASFLERPG